MQHQPTKGGRGGAGPRRPSTHPPCPYPPPPNTQVKRELLAESKEKRRAAAEAKGKAPPSRHTGVWRNHRKGKPWVGGLLHNLTKHHAGTWDTEQEAAHAVDRRARSVPLRGACSWAPHTRTLARLRGAAPPPRPAPLPCRLRYWLKRDAAATDYNLPELMGEDVLAHLNSITLDQVRAGALEPAGGGAAAAGDRAASPPPTPP